MSRPTGPGVLRQGMSGSTRRPANPCTTAAHVVEAVAVGVERIDRSGSDIAVGPGVTPGELTLEHIHPMDSSGLELIAPRERLAVDPASGGDLPFGFRGQPGSRPRAVGPGIDPRDMDDRMVQPTLDI